MNWQTIDSVPDELADFRGIIAYRNGLVWHAIRRNGDWRLANSDILSWEYQLVPTHWMPLPPPPSTT